MSSSWDIGNTWKQTGDSINGESHYEYSGSSVSLSDDGSIVAIGAIGNEVYGNGSGQTRIYQYSSGSWSQLGSDITGVWAGDYSGASVSLSDDGSIVAIGAFGHDGGVYTWKNNSGHTRIYQYSSGSWSQLGNDIYGEAADDYSGRSVSLSGDGSIVAIGAYGNDENGTNSGHTRIYQYSSGSWSQLGNDIDGEAADDFSGSSVSLSGDGSIVAIGSIGNDENGANSGHTRIYQYSSGSWSQLGNDIDGEAAGDYSGSSVSLSGDGSIVAIGAIGNDENGNLSGHTRIYQYSSGSWSQLGSDIDGETSQNYSGDSVSLSDDGSIVAIGAPYNSSGGNGRFSGHARIYQYANGEWTQLGNDFDGVEEYNYFGASVSLSGDGTKVAIGADRNDNTFQMSGQTRIYQQVDTLAPTITSFSPADNATDVATTSNIVLNFSEAVNVGSGNITIYSADNNAYSAQGSLHDYQSHNTIALLHKTDNSSSMIPGLSSYLGVSADSKTTSEWYTELINNWTITVEGVEYELAEKSFWDPDDYYFYFTTTPEYNEGTPSGNITWNYQAKVVEEIDVTSDQVTGSGSTQITIDPSIDLAEQTEYYVQIAATAFDDSAGNSYAGINDTTSLSFTTADETAPILSSSTPADNATAVATDSNIVLNFSEVVNVGSGNIVIYRSSDDSEVETFNVASSGLISGSGSTQITINPTNDLLKGTEYYVQIAATAFDDVNDNSYEGISDKTTLSFKTEATSFINKSALSNAIDEWIKDQDAAKELYGDINKWDVSQITDFSSLFEDEDTFNSDISNWDVSNGTDFSSMFSSAEAFNQDISGWDVSNGTDFTGMFSLASEFNQDIGSWDVSSGTNFLGMFGDAYKFDQDISRWDVSNGTDFTNMFLYALGFNQDLSEWDVSNGTDFNSMFAYAEAFNGDISSWDVSNGTDFSSMFSSAKAFNQDISSWDVSNGKYFSGMFYYALEFNQDLSEWDVSNGKDFEYMFSNSEAFNQDISSWDVSNGKDFERMFEKSSAFNQDIGDWDVSNGRDFEYMFSNAGAFNQDIGSWDVSNGTVFRYMFSKAEAFNQDISSWDVSSGTDFRYMFNGASEFDQDISSWEVDANANLNNMFEGADLMQSNQQFSSTPKSSDFNKKLIYTFTNKSALSNAIDEWIEDQDNATETYGDINTWDVSQITDFSNLFEEKNTFNSDISNWDVSSGTDFAGMFENSSAFNQDIGDWDVSNGKNFDSMFSAARSFDQDISSWDVSSGTDFRYMFYGASEFDQDISSWDVSNGTHFRSMLAYAESFNQDIGDWDVSNGTDFSWMFSNAEAFNGDISTWDVSSGTDFSYMFSNAEAFNGDISTWDVSSGTDFSYMFSNTSTSTFNQDISSWDVSNGTDFSYMFYKASEFDQDITPWEVDANANLRDMFRNADLMQLNQQFSSYPKSSDFNKKLPTYSVTLSTSSIAEGGTLKTSIKTTEVPNNTILYWSLSGNNIDSDDVIGGNLTGSGKVKNGKLNLSHKFDKDLITEGDETLKLKLFTDSALTEQVGDTKEITIEDVIPTYAINTKSSIAEGGTLKTSIKTTEVPNNTILYWSLSGNNIDSDDVIGGNLTGSGKVKNGKLNLSHKFDKDLITEGNETVELKLFTDAERTVQVGDTKKITIEDVIPTYSVKPSTSSIAEGGTLKTSIKTTEVPNNTILYWSLSGDDIDSDDVIGGNLTGSGKVRNGKLSLSHKFDKDLITEGNETVDLKLFTDSALTEQVGDTKEITIEDVIPTYSVEPSTSSIAEGGTLTTSIKTTEVPNNTTLYWSLSGNNIDSDDVIGGNLTGSGKVKNGKLNLSHKFDKDLITEGDETLKLKLFTDSALTEQVGDTKEITIEDVIPTYSVKPSTSSIAEGGTLKTSIKTTEVPNNTTLYWSLGGDIDSDDVIGGNLTGSGKVKNGKLNLSHKFDKDLITEGDETLELKLFTDAERTVQVGDTKEITIEDVIPTYSVKPSTSSIAEGGTLKTSIKTTEVPNNATLYWSLGGDIDSDDVIGGNLTGSGKVKNGKLNLSHKFDKDLITEGNETLELKLFTDSALTEQVGDTKEITIEDVIPTYSVKPSTSSIAEGGTLTTSIKTTEVPNNATLYWSLSGNNIDSDDVIGGNLTGSGKVKNGKLNLSHKFDKDLITEGDETLKLKLFTDSALTEQVGDTKEITIEDVIPTYSVKPSTNSVAEGGTLTTSIKTTEVPNSTILYWSLSGNNIDSDDVIGGNLTGSGKVKNGKLNLSHKFDKDLITEGDETLKLKLFTDSALTEQVGDTKEITIEDVIPTYSVKPSTSSIAEGGTLKTSIKTKEVPNNKILYWSLSGNNIDSDDVIGGNLTGSGKVKNGKLNLSHKFDKDQITEGDETLKLKLFTDSALTEQVGSTKEIVIQDTSRSPLDIEFVYEFDSKIGTRGNDYFYSDEGNEIFWGLGGNDYFESNGLDFNDEQIFLGGSGNDTYRIPNDLNGATIIYEAPNHGASDYLYVGSDYLDNGLFVKLDKQHFVAYAGDHFLVVIDALKNTEIEYINIDGTSYSGEYFKKNLSKFSGYQGNVSWNEAKLAFGNETIQNLQKAISDIKTSVKNVDESLYGRDESLHERVGNSKSYAMNRNNNLISGSSSDKLYGGRSDDNLRGDSTPDYLYGVEGNGKLDGGYGEDNLYGGSGNDIFQINKGAVRDIFSDYDNETNSVELVDELKESDLTCSYIGVDKQIKYENDLMAIIQNTIAEDFTFV